MLLTYFSWMSLVSLMLLWDDFRLDSMICRELLSVEMFLAMLAHAATLLKIHLELILRFVVAQVFLCCAFFSDELELEEAILLIPKCASKHHLVSAASLGPILNILL